MFRFMPGKQQCWFLNKSYRSIFDLSISEYMKLYRSVWIKNTINLDTLLGENTARRAQLFCLFLKMEIKGNIQSTKTIAHIFCYFLLQLIKYLLVT